MAIAVSDNRNIEDLDWRDFSRISDVMQQATGIDLPDSKRPLVQARLLRRLRVMRLTDYSAYCDIIECVENVDERLEMVSALTTNVTSFFREAHHFEYLRTYCLADLSARLKAGGSVRVWSAGCSSGEEPYSLVLTFLASFPDIVNYDFKVLATDINPVVLDVAAKGIYPETALRNVPERLRTTYFDSVSGTDGQCRIRKSARDLIAFRRLNLIEPWPMKRRFDVIMCRNVVIYFCDDTKNAIWARILGQLAPAGVLFSGHSERLSGPASKELKLVATTTYRANTYNGDRERTP